MKATQITGWLLLILGLVVIFYTLLASYNIFTGRQEVYSLFSIEAQSSSNIVQLPSSVSTQMQKVIQNQLNGVIPQGSIPKILNLLAWSILASILLMGGSRLSNLGVQLLRKI